MEKSKLSEAARKARNAYYKQYRTKNPEKVQRWRENYWLHVAERMQSGEEGEDEAEEKYGNPCG